MSKWSNIRVAYWRYKAGRTLPGGSRLSELLGALWWLSWWNEWPWLRRLVQRYADRLYFEDGGGNL
jgi:hypothetical protein